MGRVRVITAALMATLALIAVLTLSGVAPQANASGSGGAWTQMSPANSPMARSLASMAYDAATQQLVLFGGFGSDLKRVERYLDLERHKLDAAQPGHQPVEP